MEELFQITNVFAVINGLLVTALGATETANNSLKLGLSIGGLVVSIVWVISTYQYTHSAVELSNYSNIIAYVLPGIFICLVDIIGSAYVWSKKLIAYTYSINQIVQHTCNFAL
ncbi:MAG: hypothetical protein QNJ53_19915 [Pleurocapsa sp. MO_192.B19]|nr:hypothetical protein [Pleurocapsa sp. MO_192.B19]